LKVEEAANTDANNDWANEGAVGADWAAPPPEGAADATDKPEGRPRREREPEEEDNTLTLDQYLAQQKNKETIVPKLEARQANDGAGDDIWKGATVLAKDEDEEVYFAGKAKAAPKARAKKEDKVYIEIDGRFDRPERGGRGRGGRGGDRGRGAPRAAPRGGRGGRQNGASTVNVDDQTAFPSLS
jgi:plasminogen activator inhibitor 1 RNA-binding protein